MGAPRKLDLERRLEAYFATLRSSSLKEVLKHSAGNWQVYAAVTGSAMAMVTSASASIIGSGVRGNAPDPTGSARTNKVQVGAFTNAIQLAMARRDPAEGSFNAADARTAARRKRRPFPPAALFLWTARKTSFSQANGYRFTGTTSPAERPLERRLSHFTGRYQRGDQWKGCVSSVCQPAADQLAGAGRYGDEVRCPWSLPLPPAAPHQP